MAEKETDERKRPHLRLVVDNAEKRNPRPSGHEDDFIPMESLMAKRDELRPEFYRGMVRRQTKAYEALERFLAGREFPCGLDPRHGRLIVVPARFVAPEVLEHGGSAQDEVLLFVAEDPVGEGLCLSLEMILPFWSDDDGVMEDALLSAPILPYGTLFLEENRQDGYLDLIYRLAFSLYPPAPTSRILGKLFAIAAYELRETLRGLDEYPEG